MDTHATEGRSWPPPGDGRLALRLGNDTAQVAAGQQALHDFLEAQGVGARALYHVELAFEELITNIVRHGYSGQSTSSPAIDVSLAVRSDEIVLTVEDTAPPFDPVRAVAPPLPASIEDARIGGLGLRLVRMAAKRIEYERAGDRNRVTVGIART
jgi:serine/threonine-protein kinase RsbW